MSNKKESYFSNCLRQYVNKRIPDTFIIEEAKKKHGIYPSLLKLLSNNEDIYCYDKKNKWKQFSNVTSDKLFQTFANESNRMSEKGREIHELSLKHLEYICYSMKIDPNTILSNEKNDYTCCYEWDEKNLKLFLNLVIQNEKNMNKFKYIKIANDHLTETFLYLNIENLFKNKTSLSDKLKIIKGKKTYIFVFNTEKYLGTSIEENNLFSSKAMTMNYKSALLLFDGIKDKCRDNYKYNISDILSLNDSAEYLVSNFNIYPKTLITLLSSEYKESNVDCEDETIQRLSDIFDNLSIKYSLIKYKD